jgi:hypothetical protein
VIVVARAGGVGADILRRVQWAVIAVRGDGFATAFTLLLHTKCVLGRRVDDVVDPTKSRQQDAMSSISTLSLGYALLTPISCLFVCPLTQ